MTLQISHAELVIQLQLSSTYIISNNDGDSPYMRISAGYSSFMRISASDSPFMRISAGDTLYVYVNQPCSKECGKSVLEEVVDKVKAYESKCFEFSYGNILAT